MTDKLAFDVGLQEDATGQGLEGEGTMGTLQAGGCRRSAEPWAWAWQCSGGRDGGSGLRVGGVAGHILERESEGGSQGLGGREVVAVIRELEAEGLGGLVAGNALGKSILDHHHPDSPLLPSPIGEACWWTTHPASKQRSEGEKVRVGDDLILVSVSSERYLVSAPPRPRRSYTPPPLSPPRGWN